MWTYQTLFSIDTSLYSNNLKMSQKIAFFFCNLLLLKGNILATLIACFNCTFKLYNYVLGSLYNIPVYSLSPEISVWLSLNLFCFLSLAELFLYKGGNSRIMQNVGMVYCCLLTFIKWRLLGWIFNNIFLVKKGKKLKTKVSNKWWLSLHVQNLDCF